MDSAAPNRPLARLITALGGPVLALAPLHLVVLIAAWPILLGGAEPRPEALLVLWLVAGAVIGGVDGLRRLYGGEADTVRRRLTLGALRLDGTGPGLLLFLVTTVLGNVAGRLLVAPDLVIPSLGLDLWPLVLIGVLFGWLGAAGGIAVLLLVVVPVALIVTSFIPRREADNEPGNMFTVMSAGELRGGSIAILALAWLIPGLLLMGNRVGGEAVARLWLLSCAVAIVLAIVGVVINNRAVAKRKRAGITTPLDGGLLRIGKDGRRR